MVDQALAREWIGKADEDFKYAEASLKEIEGFYSQICFHFQQAAEKYLKAFIVAFELEFKRIHDLIQLLEICREEESSFEGIREDCIFLNRFYTDTRYPVHWPTQYTVVEGKKAYEAAGRVRTFVNGLLTGVLQRGKE
ncbi:MAG: HEPN domain-containing protein [Deltaproteobacteria bacterium]|nr:HEPN domain-containing protein [Deltaproteobacteria bacterium]